MKYCGFLIGLGAAAVVGLTSAQPAVAQSDGAAAPAPAAEGPPADQNSSQELAKKLSNPVSSMISVPFQENVDFGIGSFDGMRSTLNFQPVVPVALGADWNVIIRTIVPITYQQNVTGRGESEFGLGGTSQSFFFSPSKPGPSGIIWGAGPAFLYRTETDRALGAGKWGAGPTLVVLKQAGHNTVGLLANHIWSIAGDETRADVSSTFLQPFFSHTTAKATTYTVNLESTYDWVGDEWTVPVNLQVTQLTKLGDRPVSFGGGFKYYAAKPAGGPVWGVRLNFTLLFPQ
jgi:hypothetical protein